MAALFFYLAEVTSDGCEGYSSDDLFHGFGRICTTTDGTRIRMNIGARYIHAFFTEFCYSHVSHNRMDGLHQAMN